MLATATASDPDILTDFIVPNTSNSINGDFFTYTGLRDMWNSHYPPYFTVTKAGLKEFPALDGQSVSLSVLEFPEGSVNPPHIHPRSAELLFVVDGTLDVGFIDTTNKLYNQTLKLGDIFVFPTGLVHFQYNSYKVPATAISAFASVNAGTVSIPNTVFSTGIDDNILAKAFKTDAETVQKIKAGLGAKP
ncbi:hypothetical protein FEM48_Zijuj03G0037000 [Ziziphus jujuba var. spinosa]|uniref:Germin-like protein n=1 Tax=Ziziphus jujuba var. spinosa TaxID=714518 RepID=A0A978VMZ0_ZIZJJ|nr:hypothetical protein FEM48_Zijuj03G0037000 [Ziziphus jujuba var. spinosa]